MAVGGEGTTLLQSLGFQREAGLCRPFTVHSKLSVVPPAVAGPLSHLGRGARQARLSMLPPSSSSEPLPGEWAAVTGPRQLQEQHFRAQVGPVWETVCQPAGGRGEQAQPRAGSTSQQPQRPAGEARGGGHNRAWKSTHVHTHHIPHAHGHDGPMGPQGGKLLGQDP